MALDPKGPPGLTRPKTSSSSIPSDSKPQQIFSPAPSQPLSSWFHLLSSPSLPPVPLLPPVPTAFVENSPNTQPRAAHMRIMSQSRPRLPEYLQSNLVSNDTIISNIATDENLPLTMDPADPWTRAHVRVCTHASDKCAACSISLVCCSCRALRYTPGPPPTSPTPPVHRSRSASPTLFRDVGNGSPPPDAGNDYPSYDDDAYARALAECDTCENSSCPRGLDEPATYTITVERFDEGSEEMYDCTFRACNRSCKESFLGHCIKSRTFDNSTRTTQAAAPTTTILATLFAEKLLKPEPAVELVTHAPPINAPVTPSPEPSRPPTPLEIFTTISYVHNVSCGHAFTACPACSLGIICCGCNKLHTAPARLKLQCAMCSHYACATCTTPFCCSCRKPWFPGDSPTLVLASRFRGGAHSTKSSKKGSSSSSQSSGPGSLATAHSARNSPDPFIGSDPQPKPTQSSMDEIDAFADRTVKLSTVTRHDNSAPTVLWSANAPSPSSNLPSAPGPVFSRPEPPITSGMTEDLPTAVPSHAPSRAASVASITSAGDAGIAELLQPDPIPIPADPPALSDVTGRIHRRYPLALLKVDNKDSRHFLARDNTRVDDIANETEYLLSSNTSWPSILYFIRDILKFKSIQGSLLDFQVLMAGLAEIWSDAAEFDTCAALHDMVESIRLLPKAEKEIDQLEDVSARYQNERKAARTQLKTTEAELSRLRQAANDTLDSNARLLTKIDQLQATDAVSAVWEHDEAQSALKDAIAHSKSAMAKQVSRYQQLASIAEERSSRLRAFEKEAEDKDAYILKTEREHAEVYREWEAAERMVTTLKQQLQDATSLFETTREARRHDQEDFDERTAAFKKHIGELNAKLNLLPSGESELQSLVALANERAGIAEEEYRKKSAELKLAHKELATLKAKQADKAKPEKAPANSQAQSSKKVRWSFEPVDESSQPFWDHSNEYSRYIANMVAATVSALPNIPMQTAISTAIETVRAAGPAILSQPMPKPSTDAKRPPSPSPSASSSAALPRCSRAPSPSLPKNAPAAAAVKPAATMTFAQMAATVLDPAAAAPMHPAKAKPTWRAVETNKSLVLRPGTKGTRVSELHIRVPKVVTVGTDSRSMHT
ncbi:hypothetical protein AX14_005179 [Amanita brunnescens Koide BX004]|nr:hypothetical protein AX14_005179 [Amanita brunnescens Koide BX004]